GGYCAWAVSAKSDFAPGDPNQWTIVDNKLYLNYDQEIKQRWEQDRAQHIQKADTVWPQLIK
ncbi:YHS domain-containing (seleno)protein, partial [Vibrio splendidus]